MKVDTALAEAQGLTAEELQTIRRTLGREPTFEELGMFGALWSEHCSYKSSRIHLKTLPTRGARVVQGPGENAGVVDVGPDRVAFKIESHNHPSFIEPYQGAATGVGGILRDIFTMGARPIALFDSLRFGDPSSAKMRHLVRGVVAGIGGYGNSVGVPTVGGECVFDPCYDGNILVNVLAVGVFEGRRPVRAISAEGCDLLYVGSRTGRDGIHGAVMASATFGEGNEERRPAVQVGDPFLEKLLIEACLEVVQRGLVVGMQDMGAAGLSCALSEMSFRGGVGAEVDIDRVPPRARNLTPYEILLSESQERMMLAVRPAQIPAVKAIFERWDLEAVVLGRAVAGSELVVRHQGREVVHLPVSPLNEGAPVYDRPRRRPAYQEELRALDLEAIEPARDLGAALLALVGSPSLASKAWIWRQYDRQVQLNTLAGPGGDASLLRLKGTPHALALSTDGNGRWCLLDPYEGAKAAVAESARNVACTGARPLALTNCLNFGSPENPDVMWQFAEVVRGIGDAATFLETPVTGGNVSFYNETGGRPIHPTPVLGCLGFLEYAEQRMGIPFRVPGDLIVLLGEGAPTLGGSEHLWLQHGLVRGLPPPVELDVEQHLIELLLSCAARGLLRSAHDLSDGGLAVALAESCLGAHGADVALDQGGRPDVLLFGERTGTVLASVEAARQAELAAAAADEGVPMRVIGRVGGDRLRIRVPPGDGWPGARIEVERAALVHAYTNGLPAALGE